MILERSMEPGWLSNSYVVGDRPGGSAVLIDAGGPPEPQIRNDIAAAKKLFAEVDRNLTDYEALSDQMIKMAAEIFFKETGYNKGYGGSMHITDMSRGIMGMNGIVGDSLNAITDSIRRQKTIEWMHVRHEEVGAYAAAAEAENHSICR